MATFLALIIAGIFFIRGNHDYSEINIEWVAALLAIVGTVFGGMAIILEAFTCGPLQRAENSNVPRIMELQRDDKRLKFYKFLLMLFPLLSVVAAIDIFITHLLDKKLLISVWIVLFGLALDAFYLYSRRMQVFLSPFLAVDVFGKRAKENVADEHEIKLCKWIDALSELSMQAIEKKSSTLSNQVLEQYEDIARVFLNASKSIGHPSQDKDTKLLGITDKVSYILTYLFQRIEMMHEQAIAQKLEPVCSHCVTTMGKITISASDYDMSLAAYPLHFLGRFAKRAQEAGLMEVGIKASLTLEEIAKTLLGKKDISYQPIKEPILSILSHQTEIAKAIFKNNKEVNFGFLLHPFYELKALLESSTVASNQDTPILLQSVNQVIEEFKTLESVLKAMPPLPDLTALQERVEAFKEKSNEEE